MARVVKSSATGRPRLRTRLPSRRRLNMIRNGTAGGAKPRNFKHFGFNLETVLSTPFTHDRRDAVVVHLDRGATAPANQELADMRMVGMRAGNKRLARFKPMSEPLGNQEVEATVSAGRCSGSFRPQSIEKLISRDRPIRFQKHLEDLPAKPRQTSACLPADRLGIGEGRVMDVLRFGHTGIIGTVRATASSEAIGRTGLRSPVLQRCSYRTRGGSDGETVVGSSHATIEARSPGSAPLHAGARRLTRAACSIMMWRQDCRPCPCRNPSF